MSLPLRLSRTVGTITADRLWPEVFRLAAFVAVEGLAELCRRHLVATSDLQLGWATAPLVASMAMGWAYVAHQRLTFRDWPPADRPWGVAVFVLVSLGCLDAQLVVSRPPFACPAGVWLAATGLKFGLVRRLVWLEWRHSLEVVR